MYDIFVDDQLVYIGSNKDESLKKALKIADENPYIDVKVLDWDDEEIFHMEALPF